jgi:hypothetical protein
MSQSVSSYVILTAFVAALSVTLTSTTALAETQSAPATSCDAALADPELHFPRMMRLEPGGVAFTFGAPAQPFASRDGNRWSFALDLAFDPGPDTTIKFAAFNDACSGTGSAGTVLDYKFGNVTTRANVVTYDAEAQTITFNDSTQHLTPLGTPRYAWIEVWDGDAAGARATYSYLIDLVNSVTPVER